jgi:hypothetical protein
MRESQWRGCFAGWRNAPQIRIEEAPLVLPFSTLNKIPDKLGLCGMGVVFKGRDTKIEGNAARKYLRSHLNAASFVATRMISDESTTPLAGCSMDQYEG